MKPGHLYNINCYHIININEKGQYKNGFKYEMSQRKFGNIKGCESTTNFNGQKNTPLSLFNKHFFC